MLTASKGTISYDEEEGPEVLFLLKSGKVKLERVSPAGQKLTLAIVERGTFFGEMSPIGTKPGRDPGSRRRGRRYLRYEPPRPAIIDA
jgi:CRP-like cAMP-binding protein